MPSLLSFTYAFDPVRCQSIMSSCYHPYPPLTRPHSSPHPKKEIFNTSSGTFFCVGWWALLQTSTAPSTSKYVVHGSTYVVVSMHTLYEVSTYKVLSKTIDYCMVFCCCCVAFPTHGAGGLVFLILMLCAAQMQQPSISVKD